MRRSILAVLALVALCAGFSHGVAADFPTKNFTVICPWPAGGAVDVQCRLFDRYIKKILGKSFVISNKPGAGGAVGTTTIAKSKPDGYTFGVGTLPTMGFQQLTKMGNFTFASFDTLGIYLTEPQCLFMCKDSPYKSYAEFRDACLKNPGKMKVGVSASMGEGWSAAWLLKLRQNLDFTVVVFNGSPEMVLALTNQQVDASIANTATLYPEIHQFRPVVIFDNERLPTVPDVPCFKELGIDGMEWYCSRIIIAPKGVPEARLTILRNAFREAFHDPELQQRFKDLHIHVRWIDGGEPTNAFIREQMVKINELYAEIEKVEQKK